MYPGFMSPVTKRKVFISYHHSGDQDMFDRFVRKCSDQYEVFCDNSLDGRIRSDDPEYVNRRIREEHIVGSSITIVLCGANTWKRKYVDWEIHSTLHHEHALLGIALPSAGRNAQGRITVPDRLHDNIQSGFAYWWVPGAPQGASSFAEALYGPSWMNNTTALLSVMESAIKLSQETAKIQNGREKMEMNRD